MSGSLSADLRRRVISAIEDGLSGRKAAARFGVGIATAGAWYRHYRATGEVSPRKQGRPPGGSKLDPHADFIFALLEDRPDMSLVEIAAGLMVEHRLSVCPSTIWYFFDRRGYSFKKNRPRRRTGTP